MQSKNSDQLGPGIPSALSVYNITSFNGFNATRKKLFLSIKDVASVKINYSGNIVFSLGKLFTALL